MSSVRDWYCQRSRIGLGLEMERLYVVKVITIDTSIALADFSWSLAFSRVESHLLAC